MGEIIYAAKDASGTTGLWVSDGTSGGTSEIEGEQGTYSLSPEDLTSLNDGELVFYGEDSTGHFGLWITNGTSAGTSELVGQEGLYSLSPSNFTALGINAYFAGVDTSETIGLWVSNGTTSGTKEIEYGTQGSYSLDPHNFTTIGDLLFFDGTDSSGNVGLWVTNSETNATQEIEVGTQGSSSLDPSYLTPLGNELLFDAYDSTGNIGLWASNGTASGTTEIIAGQRGPNAYSLDPALSGAVTLGDLILFAGTDSIGEDGIWVSNGTASGSYETDDGLPYGRLADDFIGPTPLTAVDNTEVVFGANDEGNSPTTSTNTLWVSNGTQDGTTGISGTFQTYPYDFVVVGALAF
jgi:ELWxxDGT repeat protein